MYICTYKTGYGDLHAVFFSLLLEIRPSPSNILLTYLFSPLKSHRASWPAAIQRVGWFYLCYMFKVTVLYKFFLLFSISFLPRFWVSFSLRTARKTTSTTFHLSRIRTILPARSTYLCIFLRFYLTRFCPHPVARPFRRYFTLFFHVRPCIIVVSAARIPKKTFHRALKWIKIRVKYTSVRQADTIQWWCRLGRFAEMVGNFNIRRGTWMNCLFEIRCVLRAEPLVESMVKWIENKTTSVRSVLHFN